MKVQIYTCIEHYYVDVLVQFRDLNCKDLRRIVIPRIRKLKSLLVINLVNRADKVERKLG